VYGPNSEAVAA